VVRFGELEDNWPLGAMQETAMLGKIALIALVGVTVFGVSIASSLASKDDNVGDRRDRTGSVVPCSLDGVNPAYHPEIFGNPAAAFAQYGFTRSRDGTWHVVPNCHR
jgi:hypothetical protein